MIAVRYTCDGPNVSPPMRWSGVPKGTAELVLIVMDLTASESSPNRVFAWAVAGLKPTLRGLSAGSLPAGAFAGRNQLGQSGYSVCPSRGHVHNYVVLLYAVPHSLSLSAGFDPGALYARIGGAGLSQAQSGFAYKRG